MRLRSLLPEPTYLSLASRASCGLSSVPQKCSVLKGSTASRAVPQSRYSHQGSAQEESLRSEDRGLDRAAHFKTREERSTKPARPSQTCYLH
jgi:hypothetical protein